MVHVQPVPPQTTDYEGSLGIPQPHNGRRTDEVALTIAAVIPWPFTVHRSPGVGKVGLTRVGWREALLNSNVAISVSNVHGDLRSTR